MRIVAALLTCAVVGFIVGAVGSVEGWAMPTRALVSFGFAAAIVFVFKPWKENA